MFKTTMFAAAALCTVGVFSAPAAFAKQVVSTKEVRYADLDLATMEGQRKLDSRIKGAARMVCTARSTTGTRLEPVDRDCYKQALIDTRAQVASAIDKADDTRLGG